MAVKKLVKICRPVYPPNGPWRCYDRERKHVDEDYEPAPWVREAMGARMEGFFRAIWSADEGWVIKRREPKMYHWIDEEGNQI